MKIKEWAKVNFGDWRSQKSTILVDIQELDRKEEGAKLSVEEGKKSQSLIEEFHKKLREEKIRWRQRARCKWLKEGDKNTRFFHGLASSRKRTNMISSIMDGQNRLEKKEEIIKHITDYFASLYTSEEWERPTLDNLEFDVIGEDRVNWLERKFEEEEVCQAVFDLVGNKAPGPDGFPMAFYQQFWGMLKKDILAVMDEFHQRGKLSKGMGASFIVLIPKKAGELTIKDYRPISLIGSIYKILAKVLAGRIKNVLPEIISREQGAFVMGRQILDDILVADECVHSRFKERIPGLLCKLDLEKA